MTISDLHDTTDGIAIVGMSGRFPGASNVDEFWRNLAAGVESISAFSEEELLAAGVDPAMLALPDYVRGGGVLAGMDLFDATLFGFSARDAEILDPQHRIFLECAWESLENAGYDPETYAGLIGVYAGAAMSTYLFNLYANPAVLAATDPLQLLLGNDKDHLTTQVSYKLDLRGPSIAVQTACSTSLVAVATACHSLLNYECDMALAGGVAVNVSQGKGYLYQRGGISSPDGHCRTFDADAQGTVSGYGAGIVVLKRLVDAIGDGDTIHAIIRGAAMNNDGSLKAGYTAPSIEGQAQVIAMAQAMAGVTPDTISYVEAHGTATPLGDPIEVAALNQVFRASTTRTGYCALGSVKTNIGHLDTAAGVAGLIKTVLALRHKLLPPSLHFRSPNPAIDFANSPFVVQTSPTEWNGDGAPRRAGVSSFGMGGTNAHVVLEEAPRRVASGSSRAVQFLLVSAKSATALDAATTNLARHLREHPELRLADVAYTTKVGRRALPHRRVVLCASDAPADAASAMESGDPKLVLSGIAEARSRSVLFMFPGQGAQHVDMARELYRAEHTVRAQVDLCAEILEPHLGLDLRDLLFPTPAHADTVRERLDHTSIAQPALFVVEYALARLWMEWGVEPQAMIGHSVGEYVAACLAGVMSLEDALALVAVRGSLMGEMPEGSMLAVTLPERDAQRLADAQVSLAAVNGESLSVLSGPRQAIDALEARLIADGVRCRRLRTSHAFHSAMMDPVLEPFARRLRSVRLMPPQIPYVSNLTGTWITAAEATDPEYWVQHLRQTVRFAQGLEEVVGNPDWILLEVGPGQTLVGLARQQSRPAGAQLVLPSLRPAAAQTETDLAVLLRSVGRLWMSGAPIDWTGFYARERRHRVELPTYPFERQRYWVDAADPFAALSSPASMLPQRFPLADWFYASSWKRGVPTRATPNPELETPSPWLVFADACGIGAALADRLRTHGTAATIVHAGSAFARRPDGDYEIDPRRGDDYHTLLGALAEAGSIPSRVVHLWGVAPETEDEGAGEVAAAMDAGFFSVLALAQALASRGMEEPVQLGVITSGAHEILPGDALSPARAVVLGACKVVPQEHPNIVCRGIDVAISSGRNVDERVIDQLLRELTIEPFEPAVAYRGAQRWIQTLEPIHLDEVPAEAPLFRDSGVYLITGGLGNIGLTFAELLARRSRAKLVLTSRSPFPPHEHWDEWLREHAADDELSRKIRRLMAIEEHGSEVLVAEADAGDGEQMRRVLDLARERFGTLHGVIHGAGHTAADALCLVAQADRAHCGRHFRPKIGGALVLHDLLRNEELDFVLLLSSLSAMLGGLGFVAYAAANVFLDAFAIRRNRDGGTRWISVEWDGWYFAADGQAEAERDAAAANLILPDEGAEALSRIIYRGPDVPVAVSPVDLQARLDQWIRLAPLREISEAPAETPRSLHERPALPSAYVAPRSDVETTVSGIWQQLLGIDHVGVHDNFFELGGHSLLALQLIARLADAYRVELSVQQVFEAATVAEQADAIERGRAPQGDDEEAKIAAMLDFVEQLSDSDVSELLRRHDASRDLR